MTRNSRALDRRTALKKSGLLVTVMAGGLSTISGSVAGQDPLLMDVDLPPVISAGENGTIVTAIYPTGHRGEGVINDLEADILNHPEFKGFKLGSDRANDDVDVASDGADHIRYQLLPTGNMGVFFDPSTADKDAWFVPGEDEAKLSAIDENNTEIAWGFDEVTVNRDGSESRRF